MCSGVQGVLDGVFRGSEGVLNRLLSVPLRVLHDMGDQDNY